MGMIARVFGGGGAISPYERLALGPQHHEAYWSVFKWRLRCGVAHQPKV
jgi:hypothetical protein